ncbi:glycosyltransferase family 4 protein [Methylotenera versatilis]|uniref:glycosyltransferase family 4 protein n=1 Tax=Methylotenera versatilis TaxID=1055487 RepID=UPI00068D7001|nr:glycosyltransferase family 4 protein [Methylotenera versatilis]
MKIKAYYPNYFLDAGIAGAAYHILKGMQSPNNQIQLMGIASIPAFNDDFYKNAIPHWAKSIVYKALPPKTILNLAETIFRRTLKQGDIAYLWPNISLDTYRRLKDRGCIIVHECVNTHQMSSKVILDNAYKQLNLPITHDVTPEEVAIESAKLELVDYVYSCSPLVTESMLNNGIPEQKILQTSYGLSDKAIVEGAYSKKQTQYNQPVFIFVGSISVRKGVHLLLDYWVKAKLNAKLQLVGTIEPAIKTLVEKYIGQDNIEHIPYTNDLASVYKNADVFVLPSLEEGSPLVTYMAFGAGLPLLVSPMGGGGVVTNGVEGIVLDPYDADAWVEHLQRLTEDVQLREKLAVKSKLKAPYYLWDEVAKRRLNLLTEATS